MIFCPVSHAFNFNFSCCFSWIDDSDKMVDRQKALLMVLIALLIYPNDIFGKSLGKTIAKQQQNVRARQNAFHFVIKLCIAPTVLSIASDLRMFLYVRRTIIHLYQTIFIFYFLASIENNNGSFVKIRKSEELVQIRVRITRYAIDLSFVEIY